ncbi:MAG: phosphopantetheine-binding protein [Chloroflexota bacterium]
MIKFLTQQVLHNPGVELQEDTPLVSSGLVDSFALVEVLLELEQVTNRRIPAGRVSPEDMETVRKMLETAERVGEPRGTL